MAFTQTDIDSVIALIQAKISGGISGRVTIGGITVDNSTSLDDLWKLYDRINQAVQAAAGTTVIPTYLDGIDL